MENFAPTRDVKNEERRYGKKLVKQVVGSEDPQICRVLDVNLTDGKSR